MPHKHTLAEINQLNLSEFVATLGSIYEHSPQVAAEAFKQRPFTELESLQQALFQVVAAFSNAEQLQLIRQHPRLGNTHKLSRLSEQEQVGAGLNRLAEAEQKELERLNDAYEAKFGFPFVVAVRQIRKGGVLEEIRRRMAQDATSEQARAMQEIHAIAGLRLQEIVG